MDKLKVSVLLLTQNSEKSIVRCLDSLKGFDEIVMIDGGSQDNTISIAESYSNVKVYSNPWPGFIEQRNFSIDKASHDWCFMIDSDEALTKELFQEIKKTILGKPNKKMYRVMRTEFYFGQPVEEGFGKSNWQERLFLKTHVRYTGGVHHHHLIDGKHQNEMQHEIGNLDPSARVLHEEDYGLKEWITKLPRFSLLRANEKIAQGRKVTKFGVFFEFFGNFLKIYLKSYKNKHSGFVISLQTAIFRTLVKLIIYEDQHIGFDKNNNRDKDLKDLN